MILMTSDSERIQPGESVTLVVVASGTEPLLYQWYEEQDPIPGAMLNTYTTPPLFATTGYWVEVSNSCGTATSEIISVLVGRRRGVRRP